MYPNKELEYAIIGGGISGLTLAIALHQRGLNVKIYEQAAQFAEIGAGIAFTTNALQAMKHCDRRIFEAFDRVRTKNTWPSKEYVWFDYYDGFHDHGDRDGGKEERVFAIVNDLGQAGVHRARYLDELVKLFPQKRAISDMQQGDDGRWTLHFHDDSLATADAVIGCDGIKSKVRAWMYGQDDPRSHPTYTYKYAYRALADMDDAIKAVGEEKAQNACMHMGPGGHVLTFPVNHGKTMNIVAFKTAQDDWPDYTRLTKSAHREDALRDFEDYHRDVRNLLKLCKPDLDVWAIFHLGDNPLPAYNKGSVCLIGDAAHATSPHHGAGAGMCVEDSSILADLLADESVTSQEHIEVAFATFNDVRLERGNWLVQTSRHIGDCYEWMGKGVGEDFAKIEENINTRNGQIANVSVSKMCEEAKERLKKRLSDMSKL